MRLGRQADRQAKRLPARFVNDCRSVSLSKCNSFLAFGSANSESQCWPPPIWPHTSTITLLIGMLSAMAMAINRNRHSSIHKLATRRTVVWPEPSNGKNASKLTARCCYTIKQLVCAQSQQYHLIDCEKKKVLALGQSTPIGIDSKKRNYCY